LIIWVITRSISPSRWTILTPLSKSIRRWAVSVSKTRQWESISSKTLTDTGGRLSPQNNPDILLSSVWRHEEAAAQPQRLLFISFVLYINFSLVSDIICNTY